MADITKSSSGLMYQDGFSSITDWTGDTSYFSSASDVAFITFGYTPIDLLTCQADQFDAYGVRQPVLFIENNVWYLLYDGCGRYQWPNDLPILTSLAVSYDRGLTWNRIKNFGPNNDSGGTPLVYGYAMGGIEKYGSKYYMYRVILTSTNFGPYSGDVWEADSILGPWTYKGDVPKVTSTRSSDQVVPGKPIKVGSTYHLFEQTSSAVQTGGTYVFGRRSSSTPYGTWTQDDAVIVDTNDFPSPGFATGQPENPKPFFSNGKYVLTANIFPASRTLMNSLVLSSSVTDWSACSIRNVQKECPMFYWVNQESFL